MSMRDEFDALKAEIKAGKSHALRIAERDDDGGWTKHTRYHWSRSVAGDRIDYWPTKRKWRWRGQTRHSDPMVFVRAQEAAR